MATPCGNEKPSASTEETLTKVKDELLRSRDETVKA